MVAAAPSRRLLVCLLVLGALALLGAGRANAGYIVAPNNGQSYPVTVDSIGYVGSPATIDLVVYLDTQDSLPTVWVADSPQMTSYGTPLGSGVAFCTSSSLIPFGEQYKFICRATTILMKPGRTYYWWLDYQRQDPGAPNPTDRISGPNSFSLVQQAAPPPVVPVAPPEEDPYDPHAGASTKTVDSAATLPSATVFTGARSVKHATLTQLVYKTMKEFGLPRSLAFACWNRADWLSVVEAEGNAPADSAVRLLGFWAGRQPRWLHLAPDVCTDVQALLSTRLPNARRAGALSTVIHETMHAYGVRNEAQANCFAVQLVPAFGLNMGLNRTRARYLGTLARNYVRARSPGGYWDSSRCRENGAWDLFEERNLS